MRAMEASTALSPGRWLAGACRPACRPAWQQRCQPLQMMPMSWLTAALAATPSQLSLPPPPPDAAAALHFRISAVDGETGRGVPLVLIRTGDFVQQYSDSAGNVAFFEPGLMDQPVWFSVMADGYNLSSSLAANPSVQVYDGPYNSGVTLNAISGGSATIVLDRVQHAERAYRLTGGGLYRDSVLTGDTAAIPPSVRERAVIDFGSGSIGQDTLQLATYRNKTLWLFGVSTQAIPATDFQGAF